METDGLISSHWVLTERLLKGLPENNKLEENTLFVLKKKHNY